MKYYITFFLAFLFFSAKSQNVIIINGKCPFLKDGTELSFQLTGPERSPKKMSQITKTANHRFTFKLPAFSTEAYHLYLNRKYLRFYLEPGNFEMILSDSTLTKVLVKGSRANTEYMAFTEKLESRPASRLYYQSRVNYFKNLAKQGYNNDTTRKLERIKDSLSKISSTDEVRLTLRYIKDHPNSFLNSYILYRQINSIPEDTIRNIINDCSKLAFENSWGKELLYRADSLFTGSVAPRFIQLNEQGRKVDLNDYRGKYLLIDFWASWCIPCRAEYPVIKKAFDQYTPKNFTVLGVSLDTNKEKWTKAIRDDKLTWGNVSDLGEFKNAVALQYYVSSIPANYLIDPNGIIIAKNLRGEELLKKLAEIFK